MKNNGKGLKVPTVGIDLYFTALQPGIAFDMSRMVNEHIYFAAVPTLSVFPFVFSIPFLICLFQETGKGILLLT